MTRARLALVAALAACAPPLAPTSVTCPEGRTLLDGVCVRDAVADYVACVRAEGAQLGATRSQELSASAGSLGVKFGGAAEVKETLEKKYTATDAATLEVVRACGASLGGIPPGSYQGTCKDCSVGRGDTLSCACKKKSGAYGATTLAGASQCKNGLANCDGSLTCGPCS